MKILFVASESVPFIKSGGLGDVIGSLPASLVSRDCEVACIIPLHEGISQEMRDKMEFVTSIFVPVAWRNQYCGIFKLVQDKVTWYFIDNEYYFRRGRALYGCYDDAERFAFFGNAALTILPIVDYCPDVIHCHDWQTALVPVYLRTIYAQNPFYSNI
ncbi:MAG: glycogen/starch synthase, partial [Clostridia bacterium]